MTKYLKRVKLKQDSELENRQAAILNVLEDYQDTVVSSTNSKRAIINILEDLETSNKILETKTAEMTEAAELLLRKNAIDTAILNSIGDGIIVTDSTGNITFVNLAFEQLTGWTISEVSGTNIAKVFPARGETDTFERDFHAMVESVLKNIYHSNTTYTTHITLRKDGSTFPISFIITAVKLHEHIIGLVMSFRDITKEIDIDRAKTEFVSLASHQLRTPLSAISWYTEMLLAGDMGPITAGQEKYLQEVYRGNARMIQLVNSLLNITRMSFGTFILETEAVEVAPLIESVLNEQKPDIIKKSLQLVTDFNSVIPHIQSDTKLLRMVMQNLISNAIKYTPREGKITIGLKTDKINKHLVLTVKDTGCGIPIQQQPLIFSRLFRADNARATETEGTGLGLYIVKSIVENSGGRVWFESQENKGSTFFVELPITINT